MRFNTQHTASLLRRIHDFLVRQPVLVALGDLTLPMERIDAAIAALAASASTSDARRRASVAATGRIKALTREAKFSYLRTLDRAARLVFKQDPELRSALQVPRGVRRPEQVLETLGGMADAAVQHKAALSKAGLADDFAERMHALANALRAAIDDRAKEVGLRSNACQAKLDAGQEGLAVLILIDAMVTVPLGATPPLLREWKRLYRLGRQRPVVAEEEVDVATPAPSPTIGTPTGGAPPSGSDSLPKAA